jgi:hypothetical protein
MASMDNQTNIRNEMLRIVPPSPVQPALATEWRVGGA